MTIRGWVQSLFAFVIGTLCLAGSTQTASAANLIPSPAIWRDSIAKLETPGEGCFTADYPKLEWERTACGPAPKITRVPPVGVQPNTVGNGNDYTAVVSSRMLMSRGTFPFMHNVTTEHDSG